MTEDPITIDRIELRSHRASARNTWTVVRIETSSGLVGLGECSDAGDDTVVSAAVAAARTALVGRPVDSDRSELRAWLQARRAKTDRRTALAWSTALGGIESALDDVCARAAGVPLAPYLGHSLAATVQLYANLNRTWGDRSPADVVGAARAAVAEGFPAVKIAPFDSGAGPRQLVPMGLAVVDAVLAVLPAGAAVMIDCHFNLDTAALRVALPELAMRNVYWVEDAVDARDLDGLKWLRDQTALPLAAGEHEWAPEVVGRACASGTVDYWLVDPKHAGGPNATAQLVALAGDVTVSYHNPSGPVGTAHAAHLAALTPRLTWLEYAWGEPERAGYLSPAETVDNGCLWVSDGPGIGVALSEDATERIER